MDVIFAKIILKEEGKVISRKDLINDRFDCEIFVNEIRFTNNMKLKKDNHIIYIFKTKYNNLNEMFYNCSLLSSINLSNFNTNNVTNMSYMFSNCYSLNSINLSNFNTNNVTNMSDMFYNCSSLNSINLSNFNTNNVTYMSYMFRFCSSLNSINLSNFNCDKISKTDGIENMFKDCKNLRIENVKHNDFKIRGQLLIDLKS